MDADSPEVTILLLGDAEVGKSTFLSRLTLGIHPQHESLPPYELPVLRDGDQPFTFNITMYNRPYRFCFYDTASPNNYTLLKPSFIILCFDISNRSTLHSLKTRWKNFVEAHYNYDELLPVMVLGLKRDLRVEWKEEEKKAGKLGVSVMPQEALNVAQEMMCDRYAECSALTGELCPQVLEDVARTAAKTTTEKGGRTAPTECMVM
ncbi:P-loop containing nucleoside triphosphate hydrolase protein [Mytilinidion resinicola]|uniref:P-loop containing nucleoside triphosphate hydrolase protein n=1 Tax=Mytilinidion resinicola TaxID=574789 RepID=A0A6A6ZA84_9PEZI|nr:P-loop containing nucleoside triphosphate hydrolase protein [Mytilinidion resinicola]KAF2817117.1 P-loop containing nucleoside triphosphate hydrolase protein [Mytilinidion resinicola]